ncbi:ECF transporter S component [Lactobacillus sp. ESL0791]|uniref:ECF transporter S component n=1 Tax=Lactobacillus sp. ESL0791 TaxID=2983234 RepID=UPI0023F8F64B|nr:ECF transporter S component [Lactobacillus sp. ESL0791]MDF7639546.1 ECF transporter S component [Lactobacillus sp. ESL0791]
MHQKQTRKLAITALFVAIFLLQTFIPNIGYIRIFPALPAITTVPLTVAIYAILLGPKSGAVFGLFWGLVRLFQAYTQPGDVVSLLLFQNVFIAVVPSVLAGLFPGLVAQFFKDKSEKMQEIGYVLAGVITSLTNTAFVILLTSLLFMNQTAFFASHMGHFSSNTPLIWILLTALGFNGLVEAIFTAIVTPIIATPLQKIMHRIHF